MAINYNPKLAVAYNHRGIILYNFNSDVYEILGNFNKAIAFDPKFS
jgi:hypothetical protein